MSLTDEELRERARKIAHHYCHFPGLCKVTDFCHEIQSEEIFSALKQVRDQTKEKAAKVAENGDNFAEQGHPLLVAVATAIRQME